MFFNIPGEMNLLIACVTLSLMILMCDSAVMPTTDDQRFVFSTDQWLDKDTFYPDIGNGFLGTQLFSDSIFISGMFNGWRGSSHKARIQQYLPYTMVPPSVQSGRSETTEDFRISVNMYDGITSLTSKLTEDDVTVEQLFYAHRSQPNLLVTEIVVEKLTAGTSHVELIGRSGDSSRDLTLTQIPWLQSDEDRHGDGDSDPVVYKVETREIETENAETVTAFIVASTWPAFLRVQKGKSKFVFIQSIAFSLRQAKNSFRKGWRKYQRGKLQKNHKKEWNKTWLSGVDVDDLELSRSIISSYYYLHSSLPTPQSSKKFEFYGVSPGGVAHGGDSSEYIGHVFWDQDFWMMPAVLPNFPGEHLLCFFVCFESI